MHWKKLLEGSKLYHELTNYDEVYVDYMATRNWEAWTRPDVSDPEVRCLIGFLNAWRSRYPSHPEAVANFQRAYQASFSDIQRLRGFTIEDSDFQTKVEGRTLQEIIQSIFERIATCHERYYASTATSKILHTTCPRLFVMWDSAICGGYAVSGYSGASGNSGAYAYKFLPRVRKQLDEALGTFMQDNNCNRDAAAKALINQAGVVTLTKLIDEYDYAKFTLNRDELWDS